MDNKTKVNNAMAEIMAILEKNDLAGMICLHAPGVIEFRNHITPSYSCMSFNGKTYNFKLESRHYGNRAERDRVILGTSDMIHAFADYLQGSALLMTDAGRVLDRAAGIVRNKPAVGEQIDG